MVYNISIDTTGWTQEQKNMIQAMAVSILYKSGITYISIQVLGNTIKIDGPSLSPMLVLTTAKIMEEYMAWKTSIDATDAQVAVERAARDSELNTSMFRGIKINQIDAVIDGLANMADVRIFLKKVVRYIIAKGD